MGGRRRWLAVCGVMVALAGSAQTALRTAVLYPEDLREDLEVVRRSVHLLHPDPYRYQQRAAVDHRIDSLAATITVPQPLPAFITALATTLRVVGDAHFEASLPTDVARSLQQAVPLLPLKVRVLDNDLYVEEELMGFRSIEPGSRILRINGADAGEVLGALEQLVPVDGNDRGRALRVVERDLPTLYALRYGTPAAHELELVTPDGLRLTKVVKALTGDEVALSFRPPNAGLLPWRSELYAEQRTSWMTLSTLDREVLEREGVDARRFIDLVLQEARQQDVLTLVIDVRGAGGPDLGMAELVHGMIARDPYRVVQAISFRQPVEGAGGLEPVYAQAGERSLADGAAVQVPVDDPRLAFTKPYEKAFQGKVYVVCDGLTTDAGAAFVMLAKRSGRARVVGQPTGSNSVSFCGGRTTMVTLPRSKVRLSVPGMLFTIDGKGGGAPDQGEQPHHLVQEQPWGVARGRDTVKWSLLEMIRELQ